MTKSNEYLGVIIDVASFDITDEGELAIGMTRRQAILARDEIIAALERHASGLRTCLKIEATADGYIGLQSFTDFFVKVYDDGKPKDTATRLFRKIVQLSFAPGPMGYEHVPFKVRCKLCRGDVNNTCRNGELHSRIDIFNMEVSAQSLRDNDVVFRSGLWRNVGNTLKMYWVLLVNGLP